MKLSSIISSDDTDRCPMKESFKYRLQFKITKGGHGIFIGIIKVKMAELCVYCFC